MSSCSYFDRLSDKITCLETQISQEQKKRFPNEVFLRSLKLKRLHLKEALFKNAKKVA